MSGKKGRNSILGITSSNTGRFLKILPVSHLLEICNKTLLNFPPHLKRVATLPCEKLMSENWLISELHHISFRCIKLIFIGITNTFKQCKTCTTVAALISKKSRILNFKKKTLKTYSQGVEIGL